MSSDRQNLRTSFLSTLAPGEGRSVKRILRKYSYPPDKQERATFTALEKAEVLSANWATKKEKWRCCRDCGRWRRPSASFAADRGEGRFS
ncbi:MAG TPA: type I restriction enzyme endonuclease domain-containing protein [Candidatus Dormibacteraeota bacterium]|nr:type I restriction enzyme endonuclease domain-containing protein [Candidatus Dormibacteraeota bacterium]